MTGPLQDLVAHLRWADARALDALRAADAPPPRAVALYAHVLGAEHTWLCRLRGEPARMAVWPELGLDACAALAAENAGALEGFVAALTPGGEERPVAYRNSAGAEFRSTVREILLQVALHGSYHRGQVALLLRDAGAEPRATDYIAFTRGAEAPPRPS